MCAILALMVIIMSEKGFCNDDEQRCKAARDDRYLRLRRGIAWFLSVMLIALLVGNLIGRVVKNIPPIPLPNRAPDLDKAFPTKILTVQSKTVNNFFFLNVFFEQTPTYQRFKENGADSCVLSNVLLPGQSYRGRFFLQEERFSWWIEQRGDAVHIQLVGLRDEFIVHEYIGARGDKMVLQISVAVD